uniref:EF-hand domain-containing protein n=1 Tax=Skeletonema marinoi TaxID=267567 RepID=A0A7S1VXY7_9STRA|mmetsp:Transcript_407/g.605  ORF Transcript_407/g.605 Transcript_407/m.605 type:complete len:702 (+) Transcript_407:90-2195(+)
MKDAVALSNKPCLSRKRTMSLPLRRRTLNHAASIAFLSSLFLAASSSNEPVIVPTTPRREEEQVINACASPRIFNVNINPTVPTTLPIILPRDTPQLGDGQRSMEASGLFFDSIDKDGDGQIEPEEVAMFLKNQIGELETQQAVDSEVVTVMARLDQNHDNGLGMADMHEYWMQLETLLTAEEVAEWIVYAVQLPGSVGKMFLEHSVTGYDFPEIVENGGKILSDDLGISKSSFRNKIVRQMQARMLGIGGNPEMPSKFDFKLQSCNAVSLSWERATGRVFPVHSYRIQRRGINLFGNTQAIENGGTTANGHGVYYSAAIGSNSDWKTIYVGNDLEFVDSSLETGHNYMYRIQAWNSVGKSGWEIIDLSKALKKQRCSTKPSPKVTARESASSTTFRHTIPDNTVEVGWSSLPTRLVWGIIVVVQFFYHFIRGIFGVVAMGAAIMRFRRASASSSSQASVVLPFVSFWQKVNKLSVKWIEREIIPKTMLGDRKSIKIQEQLHDERIMATGLRGYERLQKKCKNEDSIIANGHSREASKNSTRTRSSEELASPLPKEVVRRGVASSLPQNSFFWKRAQRTSTRSFDTKRSNEVSTDSEVESSERKNGTSVKSGGSSRKTSRTSPKLSRHYTDIDDGSRCIECLKKFQFAKRYKHHCSRCMSTFCHKHGRTTHPNIVSCKVPGTCLCNPCLEVLKKKGSLSQR